MCGIIGIFDHEQAEKQIKTALALLENRGKDGSNFVKLNENSFIGHTLHAIVNNVQQPIREEGILTANCEIYNWQELNQKYNFNAQNDAQLLLQFLDKFGIEKIEELDGVFAFAYLKENKLILARDVIGVKPVWFVDENNFAFASEKKVLEKLNYQNVQELNPRQILIYDLETKELGTKQREFFKYLPEHQGDIKEETKQLLNQAISKRIPNKKFGLLFSGGIDSTFLAKYFLDHGYDFTCYTAALETEHKKPSDLIYAQKVAKELNLNLRIKTIKQEEIPDYLKKVVPLIEDSNVVKVTVALTFFVACQLAKEDGCKVIFSGLGSEEIFAGYERHKRSASINQECVSGLLKMYERDLYRDDLITMVHNLELRLPFLDRKLVEYALKIPTEYKIDGEKTKLILREIAVEQGIPEEYAFRKKMAAQYGSRFDQALRKLAKKQGFSSKSAYLRTFFPFDNLKLAVLFSSGKDSLHAAHIMKLQNYNLACLIHLNSANDDSYMFQTAGTELVELQAEAMNIPLIVQKTAGEKEKELEDLELALIKAKEKYKIAGVVNGALFSTYQRDRIENVCDKLGLKIFSPLWHKPQEQQMEELLSKNFEFVFSSIAAEGLDKSWLNKVIESEDLDKLRSLSRKLGNNIICGEGGEFESVVLDCPLFTKKIVLKDVEIKEENKNTARLIIKEAELIEK